MRAVLRALATFQVWFLVVSLRWHQRIDQVVPEVWWMRRPQRPKNQEDAHLERWATVAGQFRQLRSFAFFRHVPVWRRATDGSHSKNNLAKAKKTKLLKPPEPWKSEVPWLSQSLNFCFAMSRPIPRNAKELLRLKGRKPKEYLAKLRLSTSLAPCGCWWRQQKQKDLYSTNVHIRSHQQAHSKSFTVRTSSVTGTIPSSQILLNSICWQFKLYESNKGAKEIKQLQNETYDHNSHVRNWQWNQRQNKLSTRKKLLNTTFLLSWDMLRVIYRVFNSVSGIQGVAHETMASEHWYFIQFNHCFKHAPFSLVSIMFVN